MTNVAEMPCPMCQRTGPFTPLFTAANGYPIVRCPECRLAFTDARTAPPAADLYPSFDQHDTAARRALRASLSVFLHRRAAVVERRKRTGRLLDFGCGGGAFARFMANRGFQVVGLEPFSLGAAISSPNLQLVRGPLEDVIGGLGTFDVVTMWQVLEHLENPVAVLTALRGLLRPGGELLVSVPNFASVQSSLFQGAWFHLDPPRHLLHFESSTLGECLQRAGYSVVDEATFFPEYGASGWVQSALNAVLPHKNYLYELVKDRGALQGMSLGSQVLHLIASVAGAAPLAVASIPVELLASRSNLDASLTVVGAPSARKSGEDYSGVARLERTTGGPRASQ